MKVLVPTTDWDLVGRVVDYLRGTSRTVVVRDCSAGDDAYFRTLEEWWYREAASGFVVVEHDILVRPETVDELIGCPQPWCAAPYPYFVGQYAGLGCCKFSPELIRVAPGLWNTVATMHNSDHHYRHWCTLDAFHQAALNSLGHQLHAGHPPVDHLNPHAPRHGCRRELLPG